jgi:hypothetical protein
VTWDRKTAATALVATLQAAVGGVKIHEFPPEIVNFPTVNVLRPLSVVYSASAFGIDEIQLPVAVVHGIEQDDAIDALVGQCRAAVDADPSLGGAVQSCTATELRNWRNLTGAGGVQLLLVELILTVRM